MDYYQKPSVAVSSSFASYIFVVAAVAVAVAAAVVVVAAVVVAVVVVAAAEVAVVAAAVAVVEEFAEPVEVEVAAEDVGMVGVVDSVVAAAVVSCTVELVLTAGKEFAAAAPAGEYADETYADTDPPQGTVGWPAMGSEVASVHWEHLPLMAGD